jgi:phage regulator Rha-like protein
LVPSQVLQFFGFQPAKLLFLKEVVQKLKFPNNSIVEADRDGLVKNFDRFKNLKHSTTQPKAFTEKGLYMLATILKGPQATAATIAIIEAFAKLRELSHTIAKLADAKEKPEQQSREPKVRCKKRRNFL